MNETNYIELEIRHGIMAGSKISYAISGVHNTTADTLKLNCNMNVIIYYTLTMPVITQHGR